MAREKTSWSAIQKRSEAASKALLEAWADVERQLAAEEVDGLAASSVLADELRRWTETVVTLRDKFNGAQAKADDLRKRMVDRLDQQLKRELATRRHVVVGDTSPLIVDGFVHIDVDVAGEKVLVNDRPVPELTVGSIAMAAEEELEKLRGAATPPPQFLEKLLVAYEREVRATGVQFGTPVHATALLGQLVVGRQTAAFRSDPSARNFREYPRSQFRADLYCLIASGEATVKQRRFKYASGADTSGAIFMLVPALGRVAHVGRISFEPIEVG